MAPTFEKPCWPPSFRFGCAVLCVIVGACGGDDPPPTVDAGHDAGSADAEVDAGEPCSGPPGLYVNAACDQLAPEILPYAPQFALWSDATVKDRYIAFPDTAGAIIDTADPDGWVFPVGTRIWKNFSLEGRRLETRLLQKIQSGTGYDKWSARTFQWTSDELSVVEVFSGAIDVGGTAHDIPSISDCDDCHDAGGPPDGVLGFGAIQLSHAGTETSLADLESMGLITQAIPSGLATVPGSAQERAALGYLHANCGHCHGQTEPEAGLVLYIAPGLASVSASGAYATAISQPSTWAEMGSNVRVDPGSATTSTLYQRMGIRGQDQMPPIATEMVDASGRAVVEAWINGL